MRSLSFYILRQILGPFALFTLLLTMVVWLTQSLRLLDLVINRGQSAAIFAYLSVLILPSLLVIILPIAFFGAALYTLHKLNNDSEMVVMYSAGISRAQLAIPVLWAATIAMALTYACSLYLMPAGQRAMNDKMFDVRADIGAALLREGAFTTPAAGLTVFIREISGGELRGILVHDNRNPARPLSYVAEQGLMAQTKEGARLIMINGNIQRGEGDGARLSVLRFDRYVFNLDQYTSAQRTDDRETSERYLHELIFPALDGPQSDLRRKIYLAEAHNRISAPLYCLAFALIALAATATGHMLRSSHALRIFLAAFFGAALRMLGYGAQGMAARNPLMIAALYLLPIGGMVLASMFIGGTHLPRLLRPRMPREQTA